MAEPRPPTRRHAYPFAEIPGAETHRGAFAQDPTPSLLRRARMFRRLAMVLGWTVLCIPVQAALLAVPGRAKARFPMVYWAVFARLLGIRVRVLGTLARPRGRAVIYVSNHSSWIDIAVLGGQLEGRFVAKEDVGRWPVIRTIAKAGRTVFVSRQRNTTAQEKDAMAAVLDAGEGLVLFPEGTTSDGARVLPFRTPFFALAMGEAAPILQPVSIVYDRLGGLPLGRGNRPVFAWYGAMDIASHYSRLGQLRGMRVTVVLHEPLDPSDFRDRKELAQAVWDTIAHSAATLRQNRDAAPMAVSRPSATIP